MQIKADDNIVVCLPVAMELQRTGSIYHRVPIRCTEKQCGTAAVEMVAGAENIAKEAKGLKRLLLRFPPVFCPGVKQYQSNEQDRQQQQNMSLPFALFDARKPEKSEEDNKLCTQVDAVADFIRKLVVGNQNIRRTLNLGRSGEMTQQEVQMAADMLHGSIFLSRPLQHQRCTTLCFSNQTAQLSVLMRWLPGIVASQLNHALRWRNCLFQKPSSPYNYVFANVSCTHQRHRDTHDTA